MRLVINRGFYVHNCTKNTYVGNYNGSMFKTFKEATKKADRMAFRFKYNVEVVPACEYVELEDSHKRILNEGGTINE